MRRLPLGWRLRRWLENSSGCRRGRAELSRRELFLLFFFVQPHELRPADFGEIDLLAIWCWCLCRLKGCFDVGRGESHARQYVQDHGSGQGWFLAGWCNPL